MAGHMQPMGGPGQMMPQQQQQQQSLRPNNQSQLQQFFLAQLRQTPPPVQGTWQQSLAVPERLTRCMQLATQLILSMQNAETQRIAEWASNFERETYQTSTSKEHYDATMSSKLGEIHRKRMSNEPALQNQLNMNAQMQAQARQNQTMMNMQAQQMGRGMGQPGFQQMQRPNMPMQQQAQQQQFRQQQQPQPQQQQFRQQQPGMQQQQQQFPQQQQFSQQQQMQPQQQQQMVMAMNNQAGRGMGPNPQMMGMAGNNQNRPNVQDISRLAPADKQKVMELAQRMLQNANEANKAQAREQIRAKISPQQLQEWQAQGRDPLALFYQQQAFNMLRANAQRQAQQAQQQGGQNQNQTQGQGQNQNPQAAMMQQQQSQQSLQQRQNMMNGVAQGGNDFSQFTSNMESIKDQQMNGFMAQKAGQMVVPASSGPNRNATSQPMSQSMSNQNQNQNQNQMSRPQQQQQQQQPHQQVNQAAQQSQAQLAQMKQMQGQQAGMGNMGPSQSPAMGTLNTPVSRPPSGMNQNGMNQMGAQGMGQGNVSFGGQAFNQGMQGPNFNQMLSTMNPEQRQQFNGMPPDRAQDIFRRWQQARQDQMGMNGTPQQNQAQMANRPPSQVGPGQMNPNMGGQPQGMQQQANAGNQPQARMHPQNPQAQAMMDSMDLPTNVLAQLGQMPPEVKKWKDLKVWLSRNNTLPPQTRSQLGQWQHKQFQILMQRRAQMQHAQQGQNMMNMNTGMPGMGGQMPNQPQQPQPQQTPQQQQQPTPQQQQQKPQPQPQQPQQQQGMQRPMGQAFPPPNINMITPGEMQALRAQPRFAGLPDDQLRQVALNLKRTHWQSQQTGVRQPIQTQAHAAQNQGQGQQVGPNATPVTQPQTQQQTPTQANSTPQQAQRGVGSLGPNGQMQQSMADQNAQAAGQEQTMANRGGNKKAKNQATPSPAQGGKNLKRPSPDDAASVSNTNANAQQRQGMQQPPQPPQPQPPHTQQPQQGPKQSLPFSAEDIAKMGPEQRARYEQFRKMQMANGAGQAANQAAQATQAGAGNLARLKSIGREEQRQFTQELIPTISMNPQEHAQTAQKLQRLVVDMGKIGRGLSKWYSITSDDVRARLFFKTRLRILSQFADGDKMQQLRDSFSVHPTELDQARTMLESMAKDLARTMQGATAGQGQAAQAGMQQQGGQQQQQMSQQPGSGQQQQQQQQPQLNQVLQAQAQHHQQQQQQKQQQPQSQPQQGQQGQQSAPAPLNAVNLEKNSQALKNQKTGNKGFKAPAAPTATQPPFPFGASSPHGNPSYIGKQKDMNLQLPARKKAKLDKGPGQGSQAATPSPQAGTKTSPPQPETQRPPEPAKPVLVCKETECRNSTIGYATEEALQKHMDEEHLKPKEDPFKFFTENLALALGLESDGTAKDQKPTAAAMSTTASKQGQTPGYLGVGTPKSQDGMAMKRSGSSQSKQPGLAMDPWAHSTYDAQSVLAKLGIPNGINSVVMDLSAFRSLTPKDTPESSKDSGSSEPHSDVSDGAVAEADLNWQQIGAGLLFDMDNVGLPSNLGSFDNDAAGTMDPSLLLSNTSMGDTDWSDVNIDFTKPYQLDSTLYSMDVS